LVEVKSKETSATIVNNQFFRRRLWVCVPVFEINIRVVEGSQRKIALRTVIAYKTVLKHASLVATGMILACLAVLERQRRFMKKKHGFLWWKGRERLQNGKKNGTTQIRADGREF